MKPIRLSNHAKGYKKKRGFTVSEVEKAIRTSSWKPVRQMEDRFQCSIEFPFNKKWNGKHYARKKVRPIFKEDEFEILVITVYTYYT